MVFPAPVSAAQIRAQVEERLGERVVAPFADRRTAERAVSPTGIAAVDSVLGGVPCGQITEISGPRWSSAGRKTIEARLLARASKSQFCALVDATDSFDPKSAEAAGVNLGRLLWIRCSGQGIKALEQAFKSADLLLQGSGGFGFLVMDISDVPENLVRKVPMSTWFRFRGVVETLTAPLVVVTPCPVVGSCSALNINLSGAEIRWSQPDSEGPAHSRLVTSLDFNLEVAARRFFKRPSQSIHSFSAERQWA